MTAYMIRGNAITLLYEAYNTLDRHALYRGGEHLSVTLHVTHMQSVITIHK